MGQKRTIMCWIFVALVAITLPFLWQEIIFPIYVQSYHKDSDTAQTHHDRVEHFYNRILTDYHEFHKGYLTYGLWRNLTTGEIITDYESAAENLYAELVERMNLTKDSKLLDVACGMASQDVYLFRRYGCNITSVDLTKKHIEIGQKRLEREGLTDKVLLVHASATKMPFPDNSFSHILCAEGGPHMHTRQEFFQETMRVLKPGGVFAYSETTLQYAPENFFVQTLVNVTAYLWTVSLDNYYDNKEYIKRLSDIGFTNINLTSHNLDVYPPYQAGAWYDREALYPVRGKIVTWAGCVIDLLLRALSEMEIIDYVLVTGQKPLA